MITGECPIWLSLARPGNTNRVWPAMPVRRPVPPLALRRNINSTRGYQCPIDLAAGHLAEQ